MDDFNFDWTKFEVKVLLRVSKETIWNAWLTDDGLKAWFLKDAQYFSNGSVIQRANEGSDYHWFWQNGDEKGKILNEE